MLSSLSRNDLFSAYLDEVKALPEQGSRAQYMAAQGFSGKTDYSGRWYKAPRENCSTTEASPYGRTASWNTSPWGLHHRVALQEG